MGDLCIIPARGGSKRIPRKNVREFFGKPIITYSIQTALKSGLFEEVMVSTNDPEIAQISEKYGAKVPFFRSDERSDDFASIADVIEEVLQSYHNQNRSFDLACCLFPTAPLTQVMDLEKGKNVLVTENFDSVRPIVSFSYPIQRAFKLNSQGKVDFLFPEYAGYRSQDLEKAYHDAGQFYWFKTETGLRSPNRGAIVVSENLVQDIDTLEDWELAELKYKKLLGL